MLFFTFFFKSTSLYLEVVQKVSVSAPKLIVITVSVWFRFGANSEPRFRQFCSSLRKDSVTNYGLIWTQFPTSVRGPKVNYNALNFRSSICRWRHKIRKFVVEIFHNVKKIRHKVCAKYFLWLLSR